MILVFGTVCLDRIRRVPHLPPPGGYAEVLEEREALGGEAANTAIALTLWRVEVALAGNALGLGHEGDRLRMLVMEKGIPDDLLTRDGETPVCDVYVADDGDRTMYGAGFGVMHPALPLARLPYEAGRWFTAESNMREPAREAARLAHEAGMLVYTMDFHHDPVGQSPPGSTAQFSTDWVGARREPETNLAWVSGWADANGATAILTDGAEGLFVARPGVAALALPTYPAPATVDSTGAGDVFRAGVLRSLDAGEAFGESLAFGAAAASLKVGTLGANEGIPSRREVERHRDAHPEVTDAFREWDARMG